MAKADLRNPDQDDAVRTWIGTAINAARLMMGWNLDEFAQAVGRDPRQVARWISGKETPQLHAMFAVPAFRGPLVIALAGLSEDIEVTTQIAIRRRRSA